VFQFSNTNRITDENLKVSFAEVRNSKSAVLALNLLAFKIG